MRKRRQAMALVMVLLLLVVLTVVIFGLVNMGNLDMLGSSAENTSSRAFYAARSGISKAQAELEDNWNWTGVSDVQLDGDSGYSVTVESAPWNRIWKVTSTGTFRGATRTLVAHLQLESFAKYAYFTDRDVSASGGTIWFVTDDQITGPTHTNGYYSFSGTPSYSSTVTSANLDDPYYNPGAATYTQGGSSTSDARRFYHYYSNYTVDHPVPLGGSPEFSFTGGHEEIELPANTDEILAAATHSGTNIAPPVGENQYDPTWDYRLNYNQETGQIEGLQGRPPAGSWRNLAEDEAPAVYRLRFNAAGSLEVSKKHQGTQAFDPVANLSTTPVATVHVDGFVLLDGVVDGWVTLGCTQDMHSTGDLTYEDDNFDALGIVVENDFIVESPRNLNRDRYLSAAIMTLNGSFFVDDYNQGSPRGVLHLLGGLMQHRRGAVGTFTSSGGHVTIRTGYSKDYTFDQKLLTTPPLNFPSTGNIIILSLTDQGAPGGLP